MLRESERFGYGLEEGTWGGEEMEGQLQLNQEAVEMISRLLGGAASTLEQGRTGSYGR